MDAPFGLLGEEDGHGDEVAEQPYDSNSWLDHALHPRGEGHVRVVVLLHRRSAYGYVTAKVRFSVSGGNFDNYI